jgi:hypothetical protein
MEIFKNQDHVLFKNSLGEYHLSIDEFEKLGEKEAIKLAESEILKKSKAEFNQDRIDFASARDLGFCEYGIRDFCNQLKLDINSSYSITELKEKLTVDVILKYPDEILKIFGKSCLDKFGGAYEFLNSNRNEKALRFVLSEQFITDNDLHELACKFAENVLHVFETKYPNDKRPRLAIEAKRKFIKGEINKDKLTAASAAAWEAAIDAARYAAWTVASAAARYAASAAASAAARYAARYAASAEARYAASAAELEFQINETLKILKGR